jgi:hypothetical protein
MAEGLQSTFAMHFSRTPLHTLIIHKPATLLASTSLQDIKQLVVMKTVGI